VTGRRSLEDLGAHYVVVDRNHLGRAQVPIREWTPDELVTWELRDRREKLEHRLLANLCTDELRPAFRARLNLIYAQQEERAGTALSYVRDKPQPRPW